MTVRVGTSGWVYPHWRGTFFPAGLPAARWLRYAAERTDALEVNTTFYGSARPATFVRWRDETEDLARARGFRFAIKGSKYLTHLKRLRDPEQALANFFASGLLLLGRALGPILWQLPPQMTFRAEVLAAFLEALPRTVRAARALAARHDARFAGRATTDVGPGLPARAALEYALEPRHPTFDDPAFLRLCRAHGVAVVAADTAGKHVALDVLTARLAYVRLHGSRVLYNSRYEDDELVAWAGRIERWAAATRDVYVFFDNDLRAHAAHDAIRLKALVGAAGFAVADSPPSG